MLLTAETVGRIASSSEAECVALNQLSIDRLSPVAFSPLQHVVSIDLSRNSIKTFKGKPFESCKNLWWLNLRQNQLTSLDDSGLELFSALGELDLSFNCLSPQALLFIHEIHVLRLHLTGNKSIGLRQRIQLLAKANAPWALDNVFDNYEQSVNEVHAEKATVSCIALQEPKITIHPLRSNRLTELVSSHWYTPVDKLSCQHVLNYNRMIAQQPCKGIDRDTYRLAALLFDYKNQSAKQGEQNSQRRYRKSQHEDYLPRLHDEALLSSLSDQQHVVIDLCILLGISVRYQPIPIKILEESLLILLRDNISNSARIAHDLARLPSFARAALASLLRKHLNATDSFLLNAVPRVFVPASNSRISPADTTIARHATHLLSRAQSWWTLSGELSQSNIDFLLKAAQISAEAPPSEAHTIPTAVMQIDSIDTTDQTTRSNVGGDLRQVKSGDLVEVYPKKFATVIQLEDTGVILSAFQGIEGEPYNSNPHISRKLLLWIPNRGHWRTTYVASFLHHAKAQRCRPRPNAPITIEVDEHCEFPLKTMPSDSPPPFTNRPPTFKIRPTSRAIIRIQNDALVAALLQQEQEDKYTKSTYGEDDNLHKLQNNLQRKLGDRLHKQVRGNRFQVQRAKQCKQRCKSATLRRSEQKARQRSRGIVSPRIGNSEKCEPILFCDKVDSAASGLPEVIPQDTLEDSSFSSNSMVVAQGDSTCKYLLHQKQFLFSSSLASFKIQGLKEKNRPATAPSLSSLSKTDLKNMAIAPTVVDIRL